MQLQTILNRVACHSSFVYGTPRFVNDALRPTLEVPIRPRANGRAVCSGCGQRRPGYDRLDERRFEFVPLWQIAVVFVYTMRRVGLTEVRRDRGASSLVVGQEPADDVVPGAFGAAAFLAGSRCGVPHHLGARRRFGAARRALGAGSPRFSRAPRPWASTRFKWRRGHHYLTLVYQIDEGCRRLLWIGRERTEASLRQGLDLLGESFCAGLQFVCSEMWQPYLKVLAERAGGALHILDRFHIMKQLGEAIDDVRAAEVKRLRRDGYEPLLKRSRWCLLKRPENLTDQ